MAETATKATTTPRRGRGTTAAKPTAASRGKATPAKAAAEPDTKTTETPDTVDRFKMELEQLDDTKSYSVFTPPQGTGCVGKLYVPHGTARVVVLVVGDTDNGTDDSE